MTEIVTQIHPGVKIIFSTVADGSMAAAGGAPSTPKHTENVERFLRQHDFPLHRTRVHVTYGDASTYTDIIRVTDENSGGNIAADALYTTIPFSVITLPVADCIATVVYDPVTSMLGVLHLGRHSSVEGLIESFVIEVADTLGSDPRDWYVWMSPSIHKEYDRLDYFEPPAVESWRDYMYEKDGKIHIDTIGYNRSRFVRAGVSTERVTVSPCDTYDSQDFFSHRAATEVASSQRQGRMMVAAMMRRK